MIENQAQPNPQFILWIKEAGVFRPAEVKMPEVHDWYDVTYDLARNCQIGTEDISPNTLNLVSSVYLGPIKISEEASDENIIQEGLFKRKAEFKHGTVKGIVDLAEELARDKGAPYFSVTYVHSPVERTWKFTEKDDWLKNREIEAYSSMKFSMPKKQNQPLEFMLHPTAQLYVPRK